MSGLKLVRRHNSPHWYIRGTIRGVSVDESCGVADRKIAETIRAKREWEIIQVSLHGRQATATFLEAAVGYMEAGGERRYLKRLLDLIGNTALSKIDQTAIDRAAKILLPNASPATVNRQIHTPISAVLKFAAKRGLCEYRQIERPRQPKGRVRSLAHEEAEQLITHCTHIRALVVFMLYTGARVAEAVYLDWKQVDLARAQVQFLKTKNGEPRGVPLHPRVASLLARMPHRTGPVFLHRTGKPYSPKRDGGGQIKTAFRGACRRAGLSGITPHTLRHTWATWHYQQNHDLAALMQLGGWKSEKMVLRYAHVNVSHLAQSIAVLPWVKSGEPEKAIA